MRHSDNELNTRLLNHISIPENARSAETRMIGDQNTTSSESSNSETALAIPTEAETKFCTAEVSDTRPVYSQISRAVPPSSIKANKPLYDEMELQSTTSQISLDSQQDGPRLLVRPKVNRGSAKHFDTISTESLPAIISANKPIKPYRLSNTVRSRRLHQLATSTKFNPIYTEDGEHQNETASLHSLDVSTPVQIKARDLAEPLQEEQTATNNNNAGIRTFSSVARSHKRRKPLSYGRPSASVSENPIKELDDIDDDKDKLEVDDTVSQATSEDVTDRDCDHDAGELQPVPEESADETQS